MDRRQEQVMQQLETTIEHAHRLQMEMLELMRLMLDVEPPSTAAPTDVKAGEHRPAVEIPDKPTFSVKEAAAILGVGKDMVYQCAGAGELASLRLGRRILIPRAALARMLGG